MGVYVRCNVRHHVPAAVYLCVRIEWKYQRIKYELMNVVCHCLLVDLFERYNLLMFLMILSSFFLQNA